MKSKSPSAVSKKSTRKPGPEGNVPSLPSALLLFGILLPFVSCKQVAEPPPPIANETKSQAAFTLTIQTPSAGWSIEPIALYATASDYICISQLTPPQGMASSVISAIELELKIPSPSQPRPIRHYVLGKTWNWNGNPEATFIDSLDEIKDALADAETVPFTAP